MSLPTAHTIHPVVDPLRNSRGVDKYVHEIGASWSDFMISAQENASNNTNSSFSIRFSDKMTALDPSSAIIEMPITIVKSAGLALDTFNPLAEGLSANPLQKVCRSLKISHDGISYSYDISRIIYAMECVDEVKLQSDDINDGLKMLDMCQQLDDLWGTNASPFALPQDNPAQANRRSHPITSVYDPVGDTTTISTTLHWNLGDVSPFSKKPLYPLSSDTITISFDWESGHLGRMWKVDAINATSPNANYSFTLGQARLRYKLNQLPLGLTSPVHEVYQYNQVVARTQATSAVIGAGASATISSGTYELSRVPSKIFVYLKKAEADYTTPAIDMQTADFFASINTMSLSLGNRTNAFGSASQYELFDLSKKRGLISDFSFGQFVGRQSNEVEGVDASGKGSLIVFDPIIDVCGSGGEIMTNGVTMKNVVQFNVNFTNMNQSAHRFDLNVIEVYDGVIEVDNNLARILQTFSQSSSDAVRSLKVEFPVDELRGGSVKSFFKGLFEKGKKVFDIVKPVLQETKALSKLAKFVPYVGAPLSASLEQQGLGNGGYLASQQAGRRKRMPKKKSIRQMMMEEL